MIVLLFMVTVSFAGAEDMFKAPGGLPSVFKYINLPISGNVYNNLSEREKYIWCYVFTRGHYDIIEQLCKVEELNTGIAPVINEANPILLFTYLNDYYKLPNTELDDLYTVSLQGMQEIGMCLLGWKEIIQPQKR